MVKLKKAYLSPKTKAALTDYVAAKKATEGALRDIGEDLYERHLSGELPEHEVNRQLGLHRERLVKEHLDKGRAEKAVRGKLEDVSDDLHERVLSGELPEHEVNRQFDLHKDKLVKEHLEKAKTQQKVVRQIQQGAKGGKFYMTKSGQKVYV